MPRTKSHAPDNSSESATTATAAASTNGHANGTVSEVGGDSSQNASPLPSNGDSQPHPEEGAALDPMAAAEALQGSLRAALANSTRLIQILKRNRKQARLVESTLASLRQLQVS